jgi:hypothetical protein
MIEWVLGYLFIYLFILQNHYVIYHCMIIDVFATSKAIKTSIASLVISTDCGFLQKLLCILFCFIAVKVSIMYLLATLLSCFYFFFGGCGWGIRIWALLLRF